MCYRLIRWPLFSIQSVNIELVRMLYEDDCNGGVSPKSLPTSYSIMSANWDMKLVSMGSVMCESRVNFFLTLTGLQGLVNMVHGM